MQYKETVHSLIRRLSGSVDRCTAKRGECNTAMSSKSYLGLAASAAIGINPDVLGLDRSSLVEPHVLEELRDQLVCCANRTPLRS